MSAIQMESTRIAQLADYIATLNNCGFDFFGYSIPEELHRELMDCRDIYGLMAAKKVYKRLYDLNAAAVAGRYNREQEPAPDMPTVAPLHHPRDNAPLETDDNFKRWYEKIGPEHYQLLKTLKCFTYQCNEDATANDPLYKALEKLEYILMDHIINNTPEYIKAQWIF